MYIYLSIYLSIHFCLFLFQLKNIFPILYLFILIKIKYFEFRTDHELGLAMIYHHRGPGEDCWTSGEE